MGIIFQNGFFTQTNVPSFTITPAMFNGAEYSGPTCNNPQGEWDGFSGFTVSQTSDLACGVFAYLSDFASIEATFSTAGLSMEWNGYIFSVTWNSGSTVSNGYAKVAYRQDNHQINISTVDPSNTDYLISNGGASTSLTGTFNFPATFTLLTPVIDKGGWC